MYLESSDYGYEKHYVQVPVIPEEGYQGKLDDYGDPIDIKVYQEWFNSLPKIWQHNPFHNHFIYIKPEISDKEVMDIGQAFLEEAYIKWSCDERLDLKNPKVEYPISFNIAEIEDRIQHLKDLGLERVI